MLLLSPRRIFLDNLTVLNYGTWDGDFRGFQIRESWIAFSLKAPTLQQHNEIRYCFNRNSIPRPNLDILDYDRFGTKPVADTQAAFERAS